MKFTDVKTLKHLLKEYSYNSSGAPTKSADQEHGTNAKQNTNTISKANKMTSSPTVTGVKQQQADEPMAVTNTVPANSIKKATNISGKTKLIKYKDLKDPLEVTSPVNDGNNPDSLIARDIKTGEYIAIDGKEEVEEIPEGKLSKLARKKGKKLQVKSLRGKLKKLSRSKLKEVDSKLFEINFNVPSVAKEALDLPIKCGFEAETFFYNVSSSSSSNIDDMSIEDIEYEYGDLPDSAYEDYRTWLYEKGQEEYLDDIVSDKIQEVREDEDWLNEFIDSSAGPSSEAIERYKADFEEADPQEYENREEDGWEYMNWVREYVEEEYEDEYLGWLDDAVREDYDLDEEATEAAESEYSMNDWIYDQYSYMSEFLNDYGYEYSDGSGDVEDVASELNTWVRDFSKFDDYPEYGDYGDTYTTTGWAVQRDSSIDPDEGAGAELISPVFDSPRKMLEEMKSLFEWGDDNFGTNRSTGLHVTMSWHGEPDAPREDDGEVKAQDLNKLKMALLLGDQYLLGEFGRLRNTYTVSQYKGLLKGAEKLKRGDFTGFEGIEKELSKSINTGKMTTIHFKGVNDKDSGNELIEFRVAGGENYEQDFEKVVKAVVRYATIMKAGYDKSAYRKDYIRSLYTTLRKSTEIDPEKLKQLDVHSHPVVDMGKSIVGKQDYFDVVKKLSIAVEYFLEYEELSKPGKDKEWEQSVKDYKKGTGSDPSWMGEAVTEGEPITGFIEPPSMPPSKRAKSSLKKAQENFGGGITLLSRDIAIGNNRGTVNAKAVGVF